MGPSQKGSENQPSGAEWALLQIMKSSWSEVASLPQRKSPHGPALTFGCQTGAGHPGGWEEEVSAGAPWRMTEFQFTNPAVTSGHLLHISARKLASHLRPRTLPSWACPSFLAGLGWPTSPGAQNAGPCESLAYLHIPSLAACILQLGWGQVNESPRAVDRDGPQKQEVTDTATRRTEACGWSVLTEFKSVLKVLYYGDTQPARCTPDVEFLTQGGNSSSHAAGYLSLLLPLLPVSQQGSHRLS